MRYAFLLLGVMSLIVSVGGFIAFSDKAEAPVVSEGNNQHSMKLTLSSPDFKEGESIPSKFTCDGENIIPRLTIENVPEGTESLVVVMDDPDIPESVKQARGIEKFDHWVLYNIPKDTTTLSHDVLVGTSGLNTRGDAQYTGPCPPDREHRYIFRLYAVTGTLNFIQVPTLREVEEAARGMMLESAVLIGKYERTSNNR